MADQTIPARFATNPAVGVLTGDELVPLAQGGTGKAGTLNQVLGALYGLENPPKIYRALLSQAGDPPESDPVAIVLENTFGPDIVWSWSGVGIYLGTLADAFTENKTFIMLMASTYEDPSGRLTIGWNDVNSVRMASTVDGSLQDGLLNLAALEIRVYL